MRHFHYGDYIILKVSLLINNINEMYPTLCATPRPVYLEILIIAINSEERHVIF